MTDRRYRIIVLGAGFSAPAGFPLGSELWSEVLEAVDARYGRDSRVRRDLRDFVSYKEAVSGEPLAVADVDFEEFIAYLDVEHFLGLRGSDTWSEEGNESQLALRWHIGSILLERLNTLSQIPDVYRAFVRALRPGDHVITLNYDTLLEVALTYEDVPHRLFQHRFSEIGLTTNTIDNSQDEVIVIKLHGSVDWYDRAPYEERVRLAEEHERRSGMSYQPRHPVFGPDRLVNAVPIVDGPRPEDDSLQHVLRVLDPSPLYNRGATQAVPLLLAPSYQKVLYASRLADLWHGLGRAGAYNLGMAIVGFSLPEHDSYLRQILHALTRNYTDSWWEDEIAGMRKVPLRLVDLRESPQAVAEYRERFRFLNWPRTQTYFDGFDEEAVEFLFSE